MHFLVIFSLLDLYKDLSVIISLLWFEEIVYCSYSGKQEAGLEFLGN